MINKTIGLFIISLLSFFTAFGQRSFSPYRISPKDSLFYKMTQEANQLFIAKKYQQAGTKYQEALALFDASKVATPARYKTSICWALAGDKEQAFKYLYQLAEKEYYTDFKQLSLESNFKSLHSDERWEKLKVRIKENINEIEALLPFYEMDLDYDFDQEELEKVHIPLNGETACMIPFRDSEYYGFVSNDENYKWLIKPTYEQVLAVYEEAAIVLRGFMSYVAVKPDGTLLFPKEYELITKEEKLFHAIKNFYSDESPEGVVLRDLDKHQVDHPKCILNDYYDGKGKLLFSEKAHDYRTFVENSEFAWFRYGKRYRIRNKLGELVKEFYYENHKNTFVGIADGLLIHLMINDEDSMAHYAAKDFEGNLMFKLSTRYYGLQESRQIYKYGSIGGVYQLSENLYVLKPKSIHEMDYLFCDSLGNSLGRKKWKWGNVALDFFSQEQFILSNERTRTQFVLNRQGDTIIPQPISIGDTMALFQYGEISRMLNGNYNCIGAQGRRFDRYNAKGELIKRKPPVMKNRAVPFRTKIIPWSQKVLDELEKEERREMQRFDPMEFFESMYKFYTINVPVNPTEDLTPAVGKIIMSKDTTKEREINYKWIGAYVLYENKKGETVLELPPDIIFAGYFSEGLAPAMNKERKLGFINKKGEWAIPPKYEIAWVGGYPISLPDFPMFKGGYAYLRGFKGYLDKNGKEFFSGKRMQDHYNHSH